MYYPPPVILAWLKGADQRGRKTQCIQAGEHADRNRPAPRWRHSLATYHNRTQESEHFGTTLYMFGGASATYGALDSGYAVASGQVRGMKDLWVYHV